MADTNTRALAKAAKSIAAAPDYDEEAIKDALWAVVDSVLASAPDAARQAEALRCEKCGSANIHTAWHGEGGKHPSREYAPCRRYGEDRGKPVAEHLHRTCRGCRFTWTDPVLAAAAGGTSASVYAEIAAERARQDAKWGGNRHDDDHTADNWTIWIDFVHEHAAKAYSVDDGDTDRANYRRRMIEVAALAVAAVESFDRVFPAAGDTSEEPTR